MDIETKSLVQSTSAARPSALNRKPATVDYLIILDLQTTIMASDDFRGLGSQEWLLDINSPNELLVFYLTGLGRSHVVRTFGVIENATMMAFIPVLR